jgi:hypothetical protein
MAWMTCWRKNLISVTCIKSVWYVGVLCNEAGYAVFCCGTYLNVPVMLLESNAMKFSSV